MDVTYRIIFFFISVLLISCSSDKQQFVRETQNNTNVKYTYLIDGKQATKVETKRQLEAGNIDIREFAPNSRSALLQYGEKYRYGVYIFVTNDKNKK